MEIKVYIWIINFQRKVFADEPGIFLIVIVCNFMLVGGCSDKVEADQFNTVVRAYPNPATNTFFVLIDNGTGASAELIVFDPEGEIVLENKVTSGGSETAVDISHRPPGKYHVVCKIGSSVVTTEVLKL